MMFAKVGFWASCRHDMGWNHLHDTILGRVGKYLLISETGERYALIWMHYCMVNECDI